MKIVILSISFAIISNIYAVSLQDITISTLQNNKNLEIYSNKIDISKKNEELSLKWKNIILGFGINDILISDVTARDKEAMQTQFLTLSQEIPTNNKKQYLHNINKIQTSIYELSRYDKNSKIYSTIIQNLNKYKIIYKKIYILETIKKNIKDIKELQNQIFKTTSIDQIDIIKNDSNYLNTELKIQNLQHKLKLIKIELENISYMKINKIEYKLSSFTLDNINISKLLKQNYIYNILIKKLNKNIQNIKLQNAKNMSDVKLNIGYYQRESFDDYIGFSMSYPLSVYGKEDIEVIKAKKQKKEVKLLIKDYENEFKNNILMLLEEQKIAYSNSIFIKTKLIPNKEHMLELLISNTRNSGINTIKQLKLKNEILKDKLKALDEQYKFYITKAKLLYYKGKLL